MAKKTRRHIRPHPFDIEPTVETAAPEEASQPEVQEAQPIIFPWLTVEWLLYGLIIVLALGLRLWSLGNYPLSDVEARQGLLALVLYHGDLPAAEYYSPLLVSLNWLAFLLFGSNDASARLASVLLGILLVILPITMRRLLGVKICLLATALLAISPTAQESGDRSRYTVRYFI